MRKFRFSLEMLLQHRRNLEEKERIKFTGVRNRLLAEVDRKERLLGEQAGTLSELRLKKAGPCDQAEIQWFYRYLDRLAAQIEQANAQIARLEREQEEQRQAMIEATRHKRMIENLRGKKEKEFLTALDREEQKFVDEIVVTRHNRRP